MPDHLLRQPSKTTQVQVRSRLGVAVALGLCRFLASLSFGPKPDDGLSIGGAIALLVLAAAPTAFVPALRAALLDPTRTLREEWAQIFGVGQTRCRRRFRRRYQELSVAIRWSMQLIGGRFAG